MHYHKISSVRYLAFTILLLAAAACSGCMTMFAYGGPYDGKVIDRDTRQPVVGAVVFGTWRKHAPCSKDAPASYFTSQEVLTDRKGEFEIKGIGLQFMSCLEEMNITVFKAGYEQPPPTPWSDLKNPPYREVIEQEKDRITFKLRRLTLEERRKREVKLPDTPDTKRSLFRIENNRELMEIGAPANTPAPVK
jgi:hypothetical protein